MNRRGFLKTSLAAGLGVTCLPETLLAATARQATSSPTLVTLNLHGGPDFRFAFVPRYDAQDAYSQAFWRARATTHDISPDNAAGLESRAKEYLLPEAVEHQYFGINPTCTWLKSMFDQGHVAVINNVYAATNRDHHHATLILESGNTESAPTDAEQSGWAGRLAHEGNKNIVSVSKFVRPVCFGPDLSNPHSHDNARVIGASDSRNMGLYEFNGGLYQSDRESDNWQQDRRGYMARAVSSYYAAKTELLASDSRYRRIMQSELSGRTYGNQMKALLSASLEGLALPEGLAGLYDEESSNPLSSREFGLQVRNIYDVVNFLDVLDTNIISADYGGWDHHRNLREKIEPALSDLFGAGRGLDTLFTQLGDAMADDLIIVIYGEFGRQLASNGDKGIDHGVGNSMLVISKQVTGGVYGDMFPEREVTERRFDQPGADIEGLTSFKQVLGRVCEKMTPGSADAVFPGWQGSELEDGVSLANLFS